MSVGSAGPAGQAGVRMPADHSWVGGVGLRETGCLGGHPLCFPLKQPHCCLQPQPGLFPNASLPSAWGPVGLVGSTVACTSSSKSCLGQSLRHISPEAFCGLNSLPAKGQETLAIFQALPRLWGSQMWALGESGPLQQYCHRLWPPD